MGVLLQLHCWYCKLFYMSKFTDFCYLLQYGDEHVDEYSVGQPIPKAGEYCRLPFVDGNRGTHDVFGKERQAVGNASCGVQHDCVA